MYHSHDITDSDHYFKINATTREISTRSDKLCLVQYDHDSERFTFEMPRYIEEHDMTRCSRIEIHYTNITRNKREQNNDVYIVKTKDAEYDSDSFMFSWLVSSNATQLVGSLKFSISFICLDESGNVEYEWSTAMYESIQVLAKLEHTAMIREQYPDLYTQLKKDILNSIPSSGGGGVDLATVEEIVADYIRDNPPKPGEPGQSPTIEVTPTETGYNLVITDVNGSQTIEILHGRDGEDGYTPVKGIDYFTEEEIAAVAAQAAGMVQIDQVTPDKVIFPDGATTTYALGKVKLENGMATLVEPGGTLADFFNVFVDEKNPTTTQPSVSLTFSQAKAYEVGTKVTPSYSASLNPGSYTYGPATGVTATAWSVSDTDGNTSDAASDSFPEITVGDSTSYSITAKATHGEGTIPLTNTKNEYPAGKISSGEKSATSSKVTGFRKTFYGTTTDKASLTSDTIRGLSGKSSSALSNGSTFTVTIPVGAMRVVIAYPATLRDVSSIKDVNGLNAEIASGFTKSTLAVEGVDGYTAINYKIYTLEYASANDKANTYTVKI